MTTFEIAIARVLKTEGGYVNNPADPGGETNWGITFKTARAYGYMGSMRDMTRDGAIEIYRQGFWLTVHADVMPPLLAFQALDFAVNSGIETAIRKLQAAAGVADDGHWGPITQAKVASMNQAVFAFRFLAERLDFMRKCSAWPTFSSGWAGRIAEDMRYAADDLEAS